MSTRRFYITTAIPYVNGDPHLGFALECVQADVLARHRRQRGERVHFLSGTDDNSLKNVVAAEAAGAPIAEFVNAKAERFAALREPLELSYDDFIRTSVDLRHRPGAERLWRACAASGDLYERHYEGLYCTGCEAFLRPSELDAGLCPEHHCEPERIAERNWFFRLSRYEGKLLELIESGRLRIEPDQRRNEVLGFIRGGLEDFSVSRSRERARGLGIPVPEDPSQVIYVWFDALANYISALDYGTGGERYREWWERSDERVHVIGKGIIRFHAVYWPAMLIAAGLEVPRQVYAHGYLLVGGEKMGKSNATGVRPAELVEHFGVDCYRYYFLREISFGQDGTFSWESMEQRYITDLANDLGNLANRVLTMVGSYRGGVVPEATGEPGEAECALAADHATAVEGVRAFDRLEFKRGLEDVWALVGGVNRYVEARRPWALHKAAADADLDRCLATCVDALRVIAVLVSPVMPDAAAALWDKLGLPEALAEQRYPAAAALGGTPAGTRVDRGALLFPRLEE